MFISARYLNNCNFSIKINDFLHFCCTDNPRRILWAVGNRHISCQHLHYQIMTRIKNGEYLLKLRITNNTRRHLTTVYKGYITYRYAYHRDSTWKSHFPRQYVWKKIEKKNTKNRWELLISHIALWEPLELRYSLLLSPHFVMVPK